MVALWAGWVVRVSHSENYCGPAVIAHLGWVGGGRSTYKHCGIHSAFTEDYYFSNSVLQLSPYNCRLTRPKSAQDPQGKPNITPKAPQET
ncbi:hypothetical protein V496_09579 [Pseudogymnoascus sp. VKM F-4515 (FW-2607)]|nr:hypothetical protein V496_09579 [Pseudogymnoascus sp. VKM F-4515 (FW-2607)]